MASYIVIVVYARASLHEWVYCFLLQLFLSVSWVNLTTVSRSPDAMSSNESTLT